MRQPDDWSDPSYFGGAGPEQSADKSFWPLNAPQHDTAWSEPTYHGKRKHRPDRDGGAARDAAPREAALRDAAAQGAVDEARGFGPATDEPFAAVAAAEVQAGAASDVLSASAPAPERGPDRGPEPAGQAGADGKQGPSLLASSRTMAIASLASRATGFLRTMAIAAALGTGANRIADAYNLANTLPNMVYELLLGGVLTSVIIPVLVKAQRDDSDDGVAYTQRLLSIATVGLGGATLLAVLAAPLLIAAFNAGGSYGDLASLWATLLLPEIFFYGLGAMFAAVLNTRHVYGWPAWAPVLNNLITLVTVALFLMIPGPRALSTTSITNTQVLVLGLGTTLGIVAQAVVLIRPLRATGFRWQWRFRALPHEAGRMGEFRTLTLWVLGYVAVSQVGVFAINRIANRVNGGITVFANADLLFQVPYGILGVSLLTALMPRMSRAAADGNQDALLADFRLGARLSSVALVPISLGLMVLGPSFTSVILLGRFNLDGARLVGVALAAGAFGLVPFAIVMLQQRVFYALRDARTPTFINVFMVGTKVVSLVVAASLFHGRAVIIALTVSTSLSYLAGCIAGHVFMRRRFGLVSFGSVARTIGWSSLASAVGAVAALLVLSLVEAALGQGRVAALVSLVFAGAAGVLVMVTLALRLPLPEVEDIKRSILGRRGGDRTGDAPADADASEDDASDDSQSSDALPLDSAQDVIDRLRGN